MNTGSSFDNIFAEWSADFEKKVTEIVIKLFTYSIDCKDTAMESLHMTTSFILHEAGVSENMLDLLRFLSKEAPDHAS